MLSYAFALLPILSIGTAHFTVQWPTARGFSDDTAGNFPCGGFDSVKTPRTEWPIDGSPVQLKMEHTQTNVEVLLAIGDDPGNNYNVVLRPTLSQEGLGNFCIGGLSLPEGLNISDGTPATIQVVSNGDPSGGLYQCADVTLKTGSLSQSDISSHCNNNTGIKVTQENISGNPNETTGGSDQNSPTASGAAATASPTGGVAAHPAAATWLMGAIGVAGLALL